MFLVTKFIYRRSTIWIDLKYSQQEYLHMIKIYQHFVIDQRVSR